MISWIRNLRKRRRHDKVVNDYRQFATALGDGLSYAYLGDPQIRHGKKWYGVKDGSAFHKLDELEEAYASLGYRIIPLENWIDYGGWGVAIDDLWLVKREPDERPVFTKSREKPELPEESPIVSMVMETGKPVEGYRDENGDMQYRVIED